jgi:RND family efflux transporter MFP subunit
MRAVVLMLVAAGCSSPQSSAPKKRPPPLVTVAKPTVRDLPITLGYTVDVRPIEQADLQSKIAGYVERVFVDRGDAVKRGQLLVEVRPSDLPEQVNQAREQWGQTDASFRLAEQNAKRSRELFKREMISKAELDQAEAQLEMAQAARGSAKSGLGVVSTRLGETRIVAPFSGWVSRRLLDPGALVQPGPQNSTILTLMRVDQVRVFVSVLEADAPRLKRGQPAEITVDALPAKKFQGAVTRVPPALDPNTRTLECEIMIPNPDGTLKPGMYGRAVLTVDHHAGAIVLPVEAIIAEEKDRFVYVVDGKNVAHRVKIETGFDGGDWLEITSGVKPDDEVIVLGDDLASDGAQVSVKRVEEKKPAVGRVD